MESSQRERRAVDSVIRRVRLAADTYLQGLTDVAVTRQTSHLKQPNCGVPEREDGGLMVVVAVWGVERGKRCPGRSRFAGRSIGQSYSSSVGFRIPTEKSGGGGDGDGGWFG